MKIQNITLIGYIFVILFFSWKIYSYCNPNFEKCFKENNEYFRENYNDLNQIVIAIYKLKLDDSEFETSIEELPTELKDKLENLGVNSISLTKITEGKCKNGFGIEFNINENWNIETLNSVKLFYEPCDNSTKLNYHYYDGHHIDTWGQGNGWLILSDTDFI